MLHPLAKILLAVTSAGTLAATASAQLPASYTAGDFLVGFRLNGANTAGNSNTSSVVVDIGPITNFGSPLSFTIGLGSTLSTQYGSGWASDPAVFFSLAATSSANNTNYITSAQYLTGPDAGPAVVWSRLTNTSSTQLKNKVNSLGNEFTSAGRVQAKSDPNAYANFMPGGTPDAGHVTGANIAWGYFNPTSEGNFNQGTSGVALDLIQLVAGSGAGSDLGTFSISSDGNTLSFQPAGTVPEPSTYAAMALGALALVGFQLNKARKSSAKVHAA